VVAVGESSARKMGGPKVLPAKKALPRGRPRQFDRPEAIRQALNLFWERGYEGVSTAELTRAMGIASPSLYLAFGDKGGCFSCSNRILCRGMGPTR
jgi:hypothetical protein